MIAQPLPGNRPDQQAHWLGLDVAKLSFEAAIHPPWQPAIPVAFKNLPKASFPRTDAGVQDCLTWLDMQLPEHPACRVIMEATGRYSLELFYNLKAARPALAPVIADPKACSHFSRSLRLRNKTDATDAAALARLGAERCPLPYQPTGAEYSELRDMVRRREAFVTMKLQNTNAMAEPCFTPELRHIHERLIKVIERSIKETEKLMRDHVHRHPKLARDLALLDSIPGVAFLTAAIIIGEVGDLARFHSCRCLTAFVGVSPQRSESGSSVMKRSRMSKQGGGLARKALYMACMVAIRQPDSDLGRTYTKLCANGKPPKVALGALMRKMLVIMRALIVHQTPYKSQSKQAQNLPVPA